MGIVWYSNCDKSHMCMYSVCVCERERKRERERERLVWLMLCIYRACIMYVRGTVKSMEDIVYMAHMIWSGEDMGLDECL